MTTTTTQRFSGTETLNRTDRFTRNDAGAGYFSQRYLVGNPLGGQFFFGQDYFNGAYVVTPSYTQRYDSSFIGAVTQDLTQRYAGAVTEVTTQRYTGTVTRNYLQKVSLLFELEGDMAPGNLLLSGDMRSDTGDNLVLSMDQLV